MKDKKAFTLAEMLITITVIGVVSAIVIPQLTKNFQDLAFAKSKENSLMKIAEATKQMKSQDVLSGYTTTSSFVDAFANYMVVAKRCTTSNLDECFSSSFKKADGTKQNLSGYTTGDKL